MPYDWTRQSHPKYDTSEGYGNAKQWRRAFQYRMSFDEAIEFIKDDDPYAILGVTKTSTWQDVRKAFLKKAMENHPDKHPGEEAKYNEIMKQINAAYTIIKEKLNPNGN